jgi:protein-L-isoaspartate(D-aspartate) O-methyltransferase
METDAVPAAPAVSAGDLRDAMVDKLLRWGGVRTAPVERALRVVPRHAFVPDVSLEQAYGAGPVVTHRAPDGTAISSASGPGVVGAMLEQLEVRPGHRVLEIGAGTGYNAACLAELAGPGGQVTAVDIGADIAAGACRGLGWTGRVTGPCGSLSVTASTATPSVPPTTASSSRRVPGTWLMRGKSSWHRAAVRSEERRVGKECGS